jgi:hypothetical protein
MFNYAINIFKQKIFEVTEYIIEQIEYVIKQIKYFSNQCTVYKTYDFLFIIMVATITLISARCHDSKILCAINVILIMFAIMITDSHNVLIFNRAALDENIELCTTMINNCQIYKNLNIVTLRTNILDTLLAPDKIDFINSDERWQLNYNYCEYLELLLDYGVNINSADDNGNSSLQLASYDGDVEYLELLLKYGADINKQNNDGNTALHYACLGGHIECVRSLLSANADTGLLNVGKSTAYAITTNENVLQLFQKK